MAFQKHSLHIGIVQFTRVKKQVISSIEQLKNETTGYCKLSNLMITNISTPFHGIQNIYGWKAWFIKLLMGCN